LKISNDEQADVTVSAIDSDNYFKYIFVGGSISILTDEDRNDNKYGFTKGILTENLTKDKIKGYDLFTCIRYKDTAYIGEENYFAKDIQEKYKVYLLVFFIVFVLYSLFSVFAWIQVFKDYLLMYSYHYERTRGPLSLMTGIYIVLEVLIPVTLSIPFGILGGVFSSTAYAKTYFVLSSLVNMFSFSYSFFLGILISFGIGLICSLLLFLILSILRRKAK